MDKTTWWRQANVLKTNTTKMMMESTARHMAYFDIDTQYEIRLYFLMNRRCFMGSGANFCYYFHLTSK